jgi:hypothetical protein
MKLHYITLLSFVLIGTSACNFEEQIEKIEKLERENAIEETESSNNEDSEVKSVSQSKASLELTIDDKNFDAECNEHYFNIAKERGEDMYSYSLRINLDKNKYKLNAFQLSFLEKGKIELPYEVELDFKKSATDNKLKTHLTVLYTDENDKVVQTTQDVGKIIITEMNEEKVSLTVDTKLLLLSTVNMKGEGETAHLQGKAHSIHPIITMMNGAKKEDIF